MKNLFVLLVGIDKYRDPDQPLNGCVKDIDALEKFINRHYSGIFNIELVRLANEQATYANIINAFRSHLRKAGPDDTAWFHFSGHGTEEWTATEFSATDPNSRDQTLLCYDSGHGSENLADKELAVLLHEVATTSPGGESKGTPHIVVSLDCCHSGSGTRHGGDEPEVKPRSARPRNTRRSLPSYVGGYYAKNAPNLEVPRSPHILMSACKTFQTAGDTSAGGAFTSGLVDALEKSAGEISYVDLFTHARHSVARIRPEQSPQFATLDNFDPYTKFLTGVPFGSPDRYDVVRTPGHGWVVKCGAIHGLPSNPRSPLQLEIQTPAPEFRPIGTATIKTVGASQSTIDLSRNLDLQNLLGKVTGKGAAYRAVIRSIPNPPEEILLTGDPEIIELLEKQNASDIVRFSSAEARDQTLHVTADKSGTIVHDKALGRVFSLDTLQNGNSATHIISALEKVVKWRRFVELRNDGPASIFENISTLEVDIIDKSMKRTTEQALEFKVYMSENMVRIGKEHGEWMVGIQPRLKLSASPQTMYLYTFFLNDDYSILCPEEPKIYRPYDPGAHSIDLWSGIQGFGPVASAFGTVGYFKLILTTEDFDHYHLMQSPAFTEQDAQAASSHRSSAPPVTDDWFAVTSRLTVQKILGTLQKGESLNLLGGNLSLENLAVDKLAVSATHSEQGTASADPAHQFSGLTRAGFHLVTFHGENRKAIANILELRTDQQPTPAENPLLVTIADLPGGLDQVIAIGFNGENFEVIGSAAVTNGSAAIQIRKIPDVNIPASESMVSTPFNTSPVHRSLVEWVKIGLFGIEKDLLDESFRSWDDVSDPFGLLP